MVGRYADHESATLHDLTRHGYFCHGNELTPVVNGGILKVKQRPILLYQENQKLLNSFLKVELAKVDAGIDNIDDHGLGDELVDEEVARIERRVDVDE